MILLNASSVIHNNPVDNYCGCVKWTISGKLFFVTQERLEETEGAIHSFISFEKDKQKYSSNRVR